jgi:hypothetical protein
LQSLTGGREKKKKKKNPNQIWSLHSLKLQLQKTEIYDHLGEFILMRSSHVQLFAMRNLTSEHDISENLKLTEVIQGGQSYIKEAPFEHKRD